MQLLLVFGPGLTHQGVPRARPVMPSGGMKPPRAPLPSLPEEPVQPQQQKARVPVLEKHLVSQLSEEEQKTINSKFQEATDADKKVFSLVKYNYCCFLYDIMRAMLQMLSVAE